MNNTEKYMENIAERIYDLAEKFGEVELGCYDYKNTTLEVEIKTLTSVSDPEVNYYDDGMESIEEFEKIASETFQVKTEFESDFDMGGNEYDDWVIRDGWLKLTI